MGSASVGVRFAPAVLVHDVDSGPFSGSSAEISVVVSVDYFDAWVAASALFIHYGSRLEAGVTVEPVYVYGTFSPADEVYGFYPVPYLVSFCIVSL